MARRNALHESKLSALTCGNNAGRQPLSPIISARPDSLVLLQILLAEPVPDLQAVADTVDRDAGLTALVLRLAAQCPASVPAGCVNLSEIVVHLGLKKLRALSSSLYAQLGELRLGRTADRRPLLI